MASTATGLRKDFFRILDQVAAGEHVEFTHKGTPILLVPASRSSRLSRLIPRNITNGELDPTESGWSDAAWNEDAQLKPAE